MSSTLSSCYWVNNFSGTAESWRLKTNVVEVNRNVGISNGSDFYQTTSVVIDGQTVELKLTLTGTLTSSNIWCSASSPGFNHSCCSLRGKDSVPVVNSPKSQLKRVLAK